MMIILSVVNERRNGELPFLLTLPANADVPTVAVCLDKTLGAVRRLYDFTDLRMIL